MKYDIDRATLQERLTYKTITSINAIVDLLDIDDANHAIGIVRRHLESRAEQTAPQPDEKADDFSDLLGV